MRHECKITVLETKVFPDLQEKYLANPKSGPCPFFKPGDTFTLKRTPEQDDFYRLMNGKFVGRGQPLRLYGAPRRRHYEELDERRPHDDRVLQRRDAAGYLQD